MSTRNLGFELTCDSCSKLFESKPGARVNWEYARSVRDAALKDGWVATTYRGPDGRWRTFRYRSDRDAIGYRRNPSLLDACPDCAPHWEPPYTPTAAREIARRMLADSLAEGTTAALTQKVEELAAEVIQLRQQVGQAGRGDAPEAVA